METVIIIKGMAIMDRDTETETVMVTGITAHINIEGLSMESQSRYFFTVPEIEICRTITARG